ncbi:response regulator transcription factor [Microscilla marina]|uniref:Phosphate regulon transcriptional regulatory protein PhoB n=1 Tax=Microscilla marina ATCC 23134 TaxID=313606 RepID=A1ZWI7_MICM2|nr:response regulator transcription factor [Microscilla marina]EAY25227.1 response regulator DrrA [Microscilla marina ATCC 23134]
MEDTPVYKVLVVDDEPDIVELLQYNLEKAGYEVKTANNGKEAIKVAKTFLPQLILMDIMMPKMDGVEAGRQLREMTEIADTYIIYLTARVEEYSELAAFDVGADDYITKPIRPRALLSRIAALFRREQKKHQKNEKKDKIQVGNLTIDRESYIVYNDKTPITLPKKEFEMLFFLAQNPNKVFSRDELLQNIWGTDVYVLARTVDVHIRKVREKIGGGYIKTVKGVGYKLVTD